MGSSVIFNGAFVKALKDQLKLSDTARIITGTADPTSVAQTGEPGSIYIRNNGGVGSAYIKQDTGSSTNWSIIPVGTANGYTLVQDEGSSLTARQTINFVGAGVTAADSGGVTTVTIAGSSAAGLASVAPVTKSANYTIVSGDNGKTINVDTSSTAINITLPAPSSNFSIIIKDYKGNAGTNNINILRNGSEKIDFNASDDVINENFRSIAFVSDGTDWYRVASYSGMIQGIALFGGGATDTGNSVYSGTIDRVYITTTGNASSFGSLSTSRTDLAACASVTRGLFVGGYTGTASSVIDYVTIGTASNATSFGSLSVATFAVSACSSATIGVRCGGRDATANTAVSDYVTIATTGNATNFGNLTVARRYLAACGSTTRGVIGGGFAAAQSAIIDYITIATPGNATSFGNLTVARNLLGSCSSATRGLWAGGDTGAYRNEIDYVTIATTGNATTFGNLSLARLGLAGASTQLRGIFGGGEKSSGPSVDNTIDYVTIATTGNATDFGDLSVSRERTSALSNSHGGL